MVSLYPYNVSASSQLPQPTRDDRQYSQWTTANSVMMHCLLATMGERATADGYLIVVTPLVVTPFLHKALPMTISDKGGADTDAGWRA